eukprot:TRINITY_DN4471_c0_g1_i5.p1 TRINITY_DN4471_c0_g1~~TRINITY_DN4471_c0_g1_i5.p1  ORF type:complete len:336 (+),score=143.79 TRINITY_DN4471_c0_g1_i5:266-1273(+)
MSELETLYNCVAFDDQPDADITPYQIPGGSSARGFGTERYNQYKQQVESKRRLVKSEFTATKRKLQSLRETLLEKYDKLWVLVETRTARDEERKKKYGSDRKSIVTDRKKETEYRAKLVQDVIRLQEELKKLETDFALKHSYLATFLSENGKMFCAVEKAEALDIKEKREVQRRAAHDQILEAIQGCIFIDIPDSMNFNERRERERELKALKDKYSSLENELKLLQESEQVTDDLVDRLKNKVEAIDLMEESQVEMIDSQLIKQRKLGLKIRELKQKVDRNNEELEAITDKVKTDITGELNNLLPAKTQSALVCTVCIIIVFMLGIVGYYVVVES